MATLTALKTTINHRINHRTKAALLTLLRSYRIAAAAQPQFDNDRHYSYNHSSASSMETLTAPKTTINHRINHRTKAALLKLLRSYRIAAAAQPQFDYDRHYSYNHSDAGEAIIPSPAVDSDGSTPVRGVQWVFIGKPNSERQFYANLLSKLLEVPRISITTLVRQDLNPRSFIYKQIAEAVNSGNLVPESIIFGLLSKRLEDGHAKGETGFILDGIPRTRLQAEIVDQMVDIDLVVNFKGFNSTKSSFNSNMSSHKPNNSSTDAVPNASSFYKEQMKLLTDYYQDQKKLIDFNAGNAPRETWKSLIAALHLQHLNVSSYRALPLDFRVP